MHTLAAALCLLATWPGSLAAPATPPHSSLVAHADQLLFPPNDHFVCAGIEDVNHELYGGLYAQLLYGESFEEPAEAPSGVCSTWLPEAGGAGCGYATSGAAPWTGVQLQTLWGGAGCGVQNRGLGSGGLAFTSGQAYSGYVYARLAVGAPGPVQLTAQLGVAGSQSPVAAAALSVQPTGNWTRLEFTLTPTASAACALLYGDAPPPPPAQPCYNNTPAGDAGLCVICEGAFSLLLAGSGAGAGAPLALDQAYLAPGAWGTFTAAGWPTTRRDVALGLTSSTGTGGSLAGGSGFGLGVNALRMGGSMADSNGYTWKRFRGAPWERQPFHDVWYRYTSSGWGTFEFLNMCEAAGLRMCTFSVWANETAQDAEDLVEYLFGGASATTWGALRAQDGHPQPYALDRVQVEIGCELHHWDPQVIAQVASLAAAFNASASRLGLAPASLPFVVSGMYGWSWPGGLGSVRGMALALAGFTSLDPASRLRVYWDFHLDMPGTWEPGFQGLGWPGLVGSLNNVTGVRDVFATLGVPILGQCLEEDGWVPNHGIPRALGRAILSNRLHCMSDFISQDCPADGLQVQGRNINGWDQGQLFISQNTSWLAPHGMASFMLGALASAGATTVVAVDAAGVGALDAVALRDQAGALLALRIVNYNDTAVAATLSFQGCVLTQGTAEVLTLSGGPSAENTPAQPTAVAPVQSQLALSGSSNAGDLLLPPFSFTTVVAHCKATGSTQRSISGTTCDINSPA
jgi:hypothetical protein